MLCFNVYIIFFDAKAGALVSVLIQCIIEELK